MQRRKLLLSFALTPIVVACGGGRSADQAPLLAHQFTFDKRVSSVNYRQYEWEKFEVVSRKTKSGATMQSRLGLRASTKGFSMKVGGANPAVEDYSIVTLQAKHDELRALHELSACSTYDIFQYPVAEGAGKTVANVALSDVLAWVEANPDDPEAARFKTAHEAWSILKNGYSMPGLYEFIALPEFGWNSEARIVGHMDLMPCDLQPVLNSEKISSTFAEILTGTGAVKDVYEAGIEKAITAAENHLSADFPGVLKRFARELMSQGYIEYIKDARDLQADGYLSSQIARDLGAYGLLYKTYTQENLPTPQELRLRLNMNSMAYDAVQKFIDVDSMGDEHLAAGMEQVLLALKGVRLETETYRAMLGLTKEIEKLDIEKRTLANAALAKSIIAAAASQEESPVLSSDNIENSDIKRIVEASREAFAHRATLKLLGGFVVIYSYVSTLSKLGQQPMTAATGWGLASTTFSLIGHAPAAFSVFSELPGWIKTCGSFAYLNLTGQTLNKMQVASNATEEVEMVAISIAQEIQSAASTGVSQFSTTAQALDAGASFDAQALGLAGDEASEAVQAIRAKWVDVRASVELLEREISVGEEVAAGISSPSLRASIALALSRIALVTGVLSSLTGFVSSVLVLTSTKNSTGQLICAGIGMASAIAFVIDSGISVAAVFGLTGMALVGAACTVIGFGLALTSFLVGISVELADTVKRIREFESELFTRFQKYDLCGDWGNALDFLHAYIVSLYRQDVGRNAPPNVSILTYQAESYEAWKAGDHGKADFSRGVTSVALPHMRYYQ